MRATKMAFEKRYADDSGVEFAVRFNGCEVDIESSGTGAVFPADKIDWIRDCLEEIQCCCVLPESTDGE